jgi:hypothetical protein
MSLLGQGEQDSSYYHCPIPNCTFVGFWLGEDEEDYYPGEICSANHNPENIYALADSMEFVVSPVIDRRDCKYS